MSIQEIENRYKSLKNQLNTRRITPQQFSAQVSQLRIQDKRGHWWQIRPDDGHWITWNGTAWVAASPSVQVRPAVSQAAVPPLTLAQLFRMVIKNMFKSWLIKIPMALGLAILTMIVHTYLLVGPNGGFGSGVNPILDSVLALTGTIVSGTLFWALLAGLATAFFARLRQVGIAGTISGIWAAPAWVRDSFQTCGFSPPGILLVGTALTLLVGTWIGNRLVSLQMATAAIGALIAQQQSFSYLVMSSAWGDSQRLLKRTPARFNPAWAGVGITGAIFGFASATILPFAPFLGCAGSLILIGIALALIMIQKNRPGIGVTLFILGILLSLTLVTTPVFADDGGWDEAGGTFSSWVSSQGAAVAVAHGVPPSAGALVGAMVGSSLVGIGGIASGGGVPVPTPPQENGWDYDEASGDFIPPAGTVNEDNQVWSSIPGQGWVTPEEYDWQQDNLEDGLVWDDHWGFQEPGVAQKLDAQREDQWKDFIDPVKSKKHLEEDIAEGMQNDQEWQKFQAENQAIQDMIDQGKKNLLAGAIKTYQGDADYHIMQDKVINVLSMPVKVTKFGADVAIDLLGEIPGLPQKVKYAYKFASKWAESGSFVDGVVNAGKEVAGDYIGGKIPTKYLPDTSKVAYNSKYVPKNTLLKALVGNNAKSQVVGQGVNMIHQGVTGNKIELEIPYTQPGVDD